jgi:hypothetical protein
MTQFFLLYLFQVISINAGEPRTDLSFRIRSDPSHHNGDVANVCIALEKLRLTFDMIWGFPNDCMHLFDLGVGKAILKRILNNLAKYIRGKFTEEDLKEMSKTNLELVEYVPCEFNRKPRSLKHLHHWKAVDFRFVLLYSGYILLKHRNIHEDLYNHFIALSFAYRLISTPNIEKDRTKIESARALLEYFVKEYRNIYGLFSVTYNIHNLLHVVDAVKMYGSVDNFSNYKFENYLNEVKANIRKRSQVLQQLYKRTKEMDSVNNLMENLEETGPIKPFPGHTRSYHGYKFNEFTLKSNKADSTCKINSGTEEIVFSIQEFQEIDGNMHVVGHRYKNLQPFRERPFNSARMLGILKGKTLSSKKEIFSITKISAKFVKLPLDNEFIFLPMLHHL